MLRAFCVGKIVILFESRVVGLSNQVEHTALINVYNKLDPSVFTEGSDIIALKTVLSECFLVDFKYLVGVGFSGITACAYIVECGYGQILEVFFLNVDLVELLRDVYRQ